MPDDPIYPVIEPHRAAWTALDDYADEPHERTTLQPAKRKAGAQLLRATVSTTIADAWRCSPISTI